MLISRFLLYSTKNPKDDMNNINLSTHTTQWLSTKTKLEICWSTFLFIIISGSFLFIIISADQQIVKGNMAWKRITEENHHSLLLWNSSWMTHSSIFLFSLPFLSFFFFLNYLFLVGKFLVKRYEVLYLLLNTAISLSKRTFIMQSRDACFILYLHQHNWSK